MITIEEQKDLFYNKYNIDILDLYRLIKTYCDDNALPILNNENRYTQSDFIELLLENINLKKMYLNHYQKKNNKKNLNK